MSNDHFTKVTETSWLSRIKSAVGGIVIGIILVPVSLGLLAWNEGRAVTTARSLAEGAGIVVDVDAAQVDAMSDGQLVHTSGPITASGTPEDTLLGVSAAGLRLERRVAMYQWKESSKSETRTKLGGGEETVTTYDYSKVWSEDTIDSSSFERPDGHRNPDKPLQNETFVASGGKLGAFDLDEEQLAAFGDPKPMPLSADAAQRVRDGLGGDKPASLRGGGVYVGYNPDQPAVGDLKITYELVKPLSGSIVAQQSGSGFTAYQTEAGDKLLLTADGVKSSKEMFADAEFGNMLLTWGLRFLGMLLLFFGFRLILEVIKVIADVIPLLGSIVGVGVGLAALIPTLVLGPLVIAIAWFAYRPLVAIAVLAVTALIIAGIVYLRRRRAAATPA